MSTISSGSSGLTWTSDNSSNLAITLTNIVDNTGNTVTGSTVVKGSAKAWVNFNQSTSVINGSFNVSSVTLNSTGISTINFTTAMPNANYAWAGSCGFGTAGSQSNYLSIPINVNPTTAMTTTSLQIQNFYANATTNNSIPYIGVMVFSS